MKKQIQALYIDLFCGAGGTSSGIEYAKLDGKKCAEVVACVNHNENAIKSHKANHPHTLHFIEDIRTLELSPMVKHLEKKRRQYPKAKVVLWASLECTNFSKAKGGQPRDADSRTLAEHLFRYIETLKPHYIQIENVEEFMCWGALDENGKPISRDQGSDYLRWVKQVQAYGYDYDWHVLNAADFGAYTSRKRFFGLFARHGLPIAFPEQTFAKNGDEGGMFHQYKRWRAVREVLDLDDDGESIFMRKKPLCEKTLERIYAGLIKFVAGGKERHQAWILKYNSMNKQHQHNAPSIDKPCPTVATQNRLGLVKCQFLSKQFSGNPNGKNIDIEQPAGTVTTIDHHAFVTAFYGNGFNSSIERPSPTVTTRSRHALVSTKQYLMNPQYQSNGGSIDNPCFTLIARMDKMPPYLITTKEGEIGIAIYESDSPWTRKVKEFMAAYGIIDICMRMLNIGELKRIMGFPTDYVLIGTQAEQKKFIGNAVEVNMSRVLCEALCRKISESAPNQPQISPE